MTLQLTVSEVADGLRLVRDHYPSLTGAPDPDYSATCSYSMEDGTAWCVIGRLIDLWGFRLPSPEVLANTESVSSLFRKNFPHVNVEPRAMSLMEHAQSLNDEIIKRTVESRRTMEEVVEIALDKLASKASYEPF